MRNRFCAIVFCTQLFTEKHLLVMSWHWFWSNSCTVVFMTKKKKKKQEKKNTVNVLKIWRQCFLFLQNAYKCSCSPKTYVLKVVPEHLYMSKLPSSCIPSVPVVIPEVTETGSHRCWGVWYMSRLMTKPTEMNVRPAKTQISLGIRYKLRTQAFFMWTAKTLIRLGGCPGWSEYSLGAHAVLLVLSWGGSYSNDGQFETTILSQDETSSPRQKNLWQP